MPVRTHQADAFNLGADTNVLGMSVFGRNGERCALFSRATEFCYRVLGHSYSLALAPRSLLGTDPSANTMFLLGWIV